MNDGRRKVTGGRNLGRSKCTWCAIMALCAVVLLAGTGCDEEAALRAFRDSASGSLQTGLQSIMNGVIEGMFAVFDLGSDSSTTTTTTTS